MPTHAEAMLLLDAANFQSKHKTYAAWCILALGALKPTDPWSATAPQALTVSKGIMKWIEVHHGKRFAPNTRESIRKALRDLEAVLMVVRNPGGANVAGHSMNYQWGMTPAAGKLLQAYNTTNWTKALNGLPQLANAAPSITAPIQSAALPVYNQSGAPLLIPGTQTPLLVTNDAHGRLVKDIIELMPKLAIPGAKLLFADPGLSLTQYVDVPAMQNAGVSLPQKKMVPDVIFAAPGPEVFFVEGYHSSGHMTSSRVQALSSLIQLNRPTYFVTAFADRASATEPLSSFAPDSKVWFRTNLHRLYEL